MFTCQDIAASVDSFIDEEFGDRERAEVELHLEQCENCRHLVEYRLKMKQLVAQSLQMPAPQSLRNRIFAAIDEEDLSLEESSTPISRETPVSREIPFSTGAPADACCAFANPYHLTNTHVANSNTTPDATDCKPANDDHRYINHEKIIPINDLPKTSTSRGGFFSTLLHNSSVKTAAILTAAAAAIFLVVYVPHWTVAPATTESLSVWDESVDWHRTNIPMEVHGTPQQVSNWFKGKVNFDVSPLSFGSSPDATLIGGRLASIHNRRAALLDYHVDGNDVTVIIFDGKGVRVPTDKLQMIDNQPIAIIGGPSSNVALFHRDDLTYTITADLPSAKFEHLIQRLLSSN